LCVLVGPTLSFEKSHVADTVDKIVARAPLWMYFTVFLLQEDWVVILQAAASMVVNVGSFSDPEGLEGLAHFLGTFVSFFSVLV